MSNPEDAVKFLKNACNSEIPKELEMQLKSGAMKISLQSKPKAHQNLPGFIMKKIPGPAKDTSKAIIPGQVLGKISKTVTLKYDSHDKVITKGLNTSSVEKNKNIDAFKQFRDIDVQLISGQKKHNSSLPGHGIKRQGDIINRQNVKFSKLSSPMSAGVLISSTDRNSKSISYKSSSIQDIGPVTKASTPVIPSSLLNSKDVVCKLVRKADAANVSVNSESNKNIGIFKRVNLYSPSVGHKNQTYVQKAPQIHSATTNILNKVTVGSVKISTRILQNSQPPNMNDLKADSRQQTNIKRQSFDEPTMLPPNKIQKIEQSVSKPISSANVTANQVNMGKSFSRFDVRNKQTRNQQGPRFRKIYPKILSHGSAPISTNIDVQIPESAGNFDQECPEQCGEKFSNVGDLVTHYQEAHETPDSIDHDLEDQSESQQNVIDDFVKALSQPFIIEGKKEEDSKSRSNVEEEAPSINNTPLLGVWLKPLLPMLEYFPTYNLEDNIETPMKESCQDIMLIKQELQEYEYDENDDTEECEVLSDVEEDDLNDKFDDFAQSLAESSGETDDKNPLSSVTDPIHTTRSKKLSIEEAVEEIYKDTPNDIIPIDISDNDDEGTQANKTIQLNEESRTATQPKYWKKVKVSLKYFFDDETRTIRDIQRVKLVYCNDSIIPDIKDLDLCLVVRKSINTITTVLDEDISDGMISDYGLVEEGCNNVQQSLISPEESIVLSDDEDSPVRESTTDVEEAPCSPPDIISISDDEDEVEVLQPPKLKSIELAFGQLNRRSQEDYDSDEEYDRLNFGVPEEEDEINEEKEPTHIAEAEKKDTIAPSDFPIENESIIEGTDSQINTEKQIEILNSYVKLKKFDIMSLIKTCFVRVEKITTPKDEEVSHSEDSEEDLDEDFEDELDRVFAEIEALEKTQAQGATKIDTKEVAVSDILECLMGNVMGEVVEPWSEYVTVTRVEENADKTLNQPQNDPSDSVGAPCQLESGWDRMEITSQPAVSVTPLNYYFTC